MNFFRVEIKGVGEIKILLNWLQMDENQSFVKTDAHLSSSHMVVFVLCSCAKVSAQWGQPGA